jgi:hypothetical protein
MAKRKRTEGHERQTLQWPKEKGQKDTKDRLYNGQKKKDRRTRKTDSTMAKRKRTDSTMAKRKRTEGQTMINKTVHKKLKIGQHDLQAVKNNKILIYIDTILLR